MMRAFICIAITTLLSAVASGQSAKPRPAFEVAEIRVSPPRVSTALSRVIPDNTVFKAGIRDQRYQVRAATMVDLIRTAYSVDAERVVGGPGWLDFDRFDITALVPKNTTPDTLRLMLQTLLADRFKLAVHNDSRPITELVLSLGKGKPKLKAAESTDRTGCQQQIVPPQTSGSSNAPMMAVSCRNMTMEAFAAELKGIGGGGYVTNLVANTTELKGAWDFDFKVNIRFANAAAPLAGSDAVTLADAIDKQLGLKLEEQKRPAAVIVVDKVNEKPTDNPPDVAKKLPLLSAAPEFEVALIKPVSTNAADNEAFRANGFGVQRGGRVTIPGGIIPLKQLIAAAWNIGVFESISGAPKWLDSAVYNITAKVPAAYLDGPNGMPSESDLALMLQALLTDRFKLKTHYEDQMVTAYTLVAAKPKLKKADPSNRTACKVENGSVVLNNGSFTPPPRSVTCWNITMTQFAARLPDIAGTYLHYPVMDSTALEGAWDLSFSFSSLPPSGATPFAGTTGNGPSDPPGGLSLFNALEKQLGLKLETQKRPYPVLVIDHIEEKPTDN